MTFPHLGDKPHDLLGSNNPIEREIRCLGYLKDLNSPTPPCPHPGNSKVSILWLAEGLTWLLTLLAAHRQNFTFVWKQNAVTVSFRRQTVAWALFSQSWHLCSLLISPVPQLSFSLATSILSQCWWWMIRRGHYFPPEQIQNNYTYRITAPYRGNWVGSKSFKDRAYSKEKEFQWRIILWVNNWREKKFFPNQKSFSTLTLSFTVLGKIFIFYRLFL